MIGVSAIESKPITSTLISSPPIFRSAYFYLQCPQASSPQIVLQSISRLQIYQALTRSSAWPVNYSLIGSLAPYNPYIIMSQKPKDQSKPDLRSIFRSQIVQKYPPEQPFNKPVFLEDEAHHRDQHDFLDLFMRDNDIVEEYAMVDEVPRRRGMVNYENLMASQSDGGSVPSRGSSLSSRENNLDFHNRSFDKMPSLVKKQWEESIDIEQPAPRKKSINNFHIPAIVPPVSTQALSRQRNEKINKIQQVGCNCRKSKCLKMYCQCFHLQIFCSQNCNCVDCGNREPNQGHQQAVIDALTRNPKAFEQEKPATQNGFTLGVGLSEVKKGCKCKKTKCLKKYCQCYNSGSKCGMFCKCECCENV